MSEPEKCLSVGKNFSRREWLMLIVILMMAEAGALIASHSFMEDQNVINYISFASTIASLLLAVLAIVYGFYQSESQRRAGDGVDAHLRNITATTDRMAKVSDELASNAKAISGVTDTLQNLRGAIDDTHNKLNNLEGGIISMSQGQSGLVEMIKMINLKKDSEPNNQDEKKINSDAARLVLRSNTSYATGLIAYSLWVAFKKNKIDSMFADDFMNELVKVLGKDNHMNMGDAEWKAVAGILLTVFHSVKIVKLRWHEKNGRVIIDYSPDAEEILHETAGRTVLEAETSEFTKRLDEVMVGINKA
ncbi:hypothetical protein [Delftia sp. HK171]|uniref:hypothetical protein n=1 Tax=Delftia sp. HK171 TaxID=1920191 RepID=UPI00114F0EEA|nr:hypothetical protein [Delftia sp. HK171]TQL87418.1 hypothetical protein FB549_0111 [Delftia sp. HK171]